jgi:VCBS repeat-containing protein
MIDHRNGRLGPNVPISDARRGSRMACLVRKTRRTLFLVACGAAFASTCHADIPASERAALINFYNATNGSAWSNKTGWLGPAGTECSWFGVGCNQNLHVVSLDLTGNGLSGPIPDISALTELTHLFLPQNSLSGPIPDLSALSKLRMIVLHQNNLGGAFPTWNPAAPLVNLDIGVNALSGPIPALAGTPTLVNIDIDQNVFSGAIPDLSSLALLQTFHGDINQLSGPIPPLPTGGGALTDFTVSANNLTGNVPPLDTMAALQLIDVSNNQLTGALPPAYPASLDTFLASNNLLSGPMPSLASAHLRRFSVDGNAQLAGQVAPGPNPNTLAGGMSSLCPSGLVPSNDPAVNSQWDAATGVTPWHHSFACNQQPVTPSVLQSAMEFVPSNVVVGAASQMRITIDNPNAQSASGVALTDTYPAGMKNSGSNVVVQNSCSGTLTAAPAAASMSLSGGVIGAHASCVIVVRVDGVSAGVWTNSTGAVSSANPAISSPAALGLLTVVATNHAPVTQDDEVTVVRSGSTQEIVGDPRIPSSVLDNDADTDAGDFVASATVALNPSYGTLALDPNGTFVYHNTGGGLTDSFQYYACDTFVLCAVATVHIVITDPTGTPQTITFTSSAPNDAQVGGPAYQAIATATSGLPVTLTVDASSVAVCTIASGAVSFIAAGTCTIDANQGGDATYAPALQVQQSFDVADATGVLPQAITFTSVAPTGAQVGGPTYHANATATSGLPVTLAIDASSATVCTMSAGTVTFIGAGTCTIDANQGGDADYAPASQQQQSFAVAQASGASPQTIAFTSTAPSSATVAGLPYFASATATSGLPVVLTIDGASATVCSISAGTVTFIGAGTCTINANQGGDADYAPAAEVQQAFAVVGAGGALPQTIAFTSAAPLEATEGGPSCLATAAATSGLPVILTIDAASATVCAINAGTVSFIGGGTCTIDANQGGDASYAPAAQVQQSFPVREVLFRDGFDFPVQNCQ